LNVLLLLVFLSAALVLGAIGLFAWTVRARTFDHADRLALLPLRDDVGPPEDTHGGGPRSPVVGTARVSRAAGSRAPGAPPSSDRA